MKLAIPFFLLIFFTFNGQLKAAGSPQTRPNIIIMMLDDLGYSDLGCYGSEIKTPNIDKLAKNGLRFRTFYNTAKCHSSRVSLLTGLYSDQAGDKKMNRGVTIAEVLKAAGYTTNMVGKWHLKSSPTKRGFDRYFGHLSGATNYFKGDKTFQLNGKPWNKFGKNFYTTDANISFAKQFISESIKQSPDKPFFLYIAHNAPHYPLQARKKDYLRYQGVYQQGWDKIRAARYQKQRKMGLIPQQWQLSPRPNHVPAWTSLSEPDKAWEIRRMTTFAAMVDRVDQTTGDLIQYLKQNKLFDNTLILICSDNGACPFDRTTGKDKDPWDPESHWCYDTGWAHVGNTPFRLYKQNQHAGGISSPLIVSWPNGLKTKPNSITPQPGHLIDFMATCIDLAQTHYPKSWKNIDLQPLQGKSLLPILQGKIRRPHGHLFFRFATNRALIQGPWKIVTHRMARWELYNINADGTEIHDLANKFPQIVKSMAATWRSIAKNQAFLKGYLAAPVSNNPPPELLKSGKPAPRK